MPSPIESPRSITEIERRAAEFAAIARRRRSVRRFADRPVPRSVIEHCLRAAGSAPSGANQQPWHFVVVSDPSTKHQIRQEAEAIERAFYEQRAPDDWLDALKPLDTRISKPFLEAAPYLIVVFAQRYGLSPDGERIDHYYVAESVGIATGILITAIHYAGLVTVPYTPAPMRFLRQILHRPAHERPFLLLPVGYPAPDAQLPEIRKKGLDEIATFI